MGSSVLHMMTLGLEGHRLGGLSEDRWTGARDTGIPDPDFSVLTEQRDSGIGIILRPSSSQTWEKDCVC